MWVVKYRGATHTFRNGSCGLCGSLSYWADASDALDKCTYAEKIVVWVEDFRPCIPPAAGAWDMIGKRFREATDTEMKRLCPRPRNL